MALPVTQAQRALRVAASNTIDIPNPANTIISGTTTAAPVASKLIAPAGSNFITRGVKPGDIVYNVQTPSTPTVCTVTAVDSETQLSLSANNFGVASQAFVIYASQSGSGSPSYPNLYIASTTGALAVETECGEVIGFPSVAVGFFPIRVRKVLVNGGGSNTAVTAIAIW